MEWSKCLWFCLTSAYAVVLP